MADNADDAPHIDNPAFAEKVEKLAMKLLRGGDENGSAADNMEAARRSARRMLEESEARTNEAVDLDPEDDNVIRRSSSETASTGETHGTRRVSDGD
ncbi:MAG: hypothetical protein QOG54_2453 [Actinomycetota bacterium]|jgi:hypothetical protein|nr:hypothetical protein [Actinomycetota bacterium]